MVEPERETAERTLAGQLLSFRLRFVPMSPAEPTPAAEPSSSADTKAVEKREVLHGIQQIGRSFHDKLLYLSTYLDAVASLADRSMLANMASLHAVLVEAQDAARRAPGGTPPEARVEAIWRIRRSDGTEHDEKQEVDLWDSNHIRAITEHLAAKDVAKQICHHSAIQQLVNAWEHLQLELLTAHFKKHEGSKLVDRTLTLRELLAFVDLDDAREYVVREHVMEHMRTRSTKDQIAFMRTELKIDLQDLCACTDGVRELVLRRHAIAHAGGIATAEFIKRAKQVESIELQLKEGESIPADEAYFQRAWRDVMVTGSVLHHSWAIKQCQSRSLGEEAQQAIHRLLNWTAFRCLEARQYQAAESLLVYGMKQPNLEDSLRLQMHVNHAQSLAWQGKRKEAEAELDKRQWAATSSEYQCCVAAIRGDVDAFRRTLRLSGAQETLSIANLYEWPVFQAMRKREDFGKLMSEVFGEKKASVASRSGKLLLDPYPEQTVRALKSYFDEFRARVGSSKPADLKQSEVEAPRPKRGRAKLTRSARRKPKASDD